MLHDGCPSCYFNDENKKHNEILNMLQTSRKIATKQDTKEPQDKVITTQSGRISTKPNHLAM